MELDNGAVAEMGAEWIEPSERAVRDLADAVGVRLLPAGSRTGGGRLTGPCGATREEQDAALAALAAARAGLSDEAAASATLGAVVDSLAITDAQRTTLRARLQGTFAADLSSIALRAADAYGGADPGDESDLRAEGGNARIAEPWPRACRTCGWGTS